MTITAAASKREMQSELVNKIAEYSDSLPLCKVTSVGRELLRRLCELMQLRRNKIVEQFARTTNRLRSVSLDTRAALVARRGQRRVNSSIAVTPRRESMLMKLDDWPVFHRSVERAAGQRGHLVTSATPLDCARLA